MDILEAIHARKSIRRFTTQPVPKEVLRNVLAAATRAPSAMNTQPWEFVVIAGNVLETVKKENIAKLRAGAPLNPEHLVVGWPQDGVYRTRQVELAKQLFQLMNIPREDKVQRAEWLERGFRYFDAPTAIIVVADRVLSEGGPLLDIGTALQTICLAALHYGLGTCIEDQGVMYPEVLREHADIPASKRIIMSIAIGYPDSDFPANRIRSTRESADAITTWRGI
jgi:nitroreductase